MLQQQADISADLYVTKICCEVDALMTDNEQLNPDGYTPDEINSCNQMRDKYGHLPKWKQRVAVAKSSAPKHIQKAEVPGRTGHPFCRFVCFASHLQ